MSQHQSRTPTTLSQAVRRPVEPPATDAQLIMLFMTALDEGCAAQRLHNQPKRRAQ